MSRRKAREYAFKVLFQVDQVTARPVEAFNYLLQESELAEKDVIFSRELIAAAIKNLEEIDRIIAAYASDWPLDRMPAVDRSIMRLAAGEMLFLDSVDAIVVIDEAVEIAKKYGGEASPAYINAILDRLTGEGKRS
ncbi:MAG: transcription antitermination factor NusB [Syntrophomonadaceae bacterium]|jgi:N utilization substance protein B|nr:transcription antitermination factor NusB [Syntrophomonadaceae bacterium]